MDDLEFDFAAALSWFVNQQKQSHVFVSVSDAHAKSWADTIGLTVRRCYVSDAIVNARAQQLGVGKSEIVAARLPDAGSTMAGDFGEILVYLYQSAMQLPLPAVGPKKWRLKQDRTKPAPHSDVVHFVLPSWPAPSSQDLLICAEVKTKSTVGATTPIPDAIRDSAKDRVSRLSRTLEWLKERALLESLGDIDVARLDRFIKAIDYPPVLKQFQAVAVVCQSLVDNELKTVPPAPSPDYTVVVIAVPDLKTVYSAVFDAAKNALPGSGSTQGNS